MIKSCDFPLETALVSRHGCLEDQQPHGEGGKNGYFFMVNCI